MIFETIWDVLCKYNVEHQIGLVAFRGEFRTPKRHILVLSENESQDGFRYYMFPYDNALAMRQIKYGDPNFIETLKQCLLFHKGVL